MSDDLPPARENQPFFTVTPFQAGSLALRERLFVSDPHPDKFIIVPSLSFLLQASSGKAILFDLGIKKDLREYSPKTHLSIINYFSPCNANPDVIGSLKTQSNPLGPEDITHVIISHIHWDHIGDHRPFTKAQFVVGAPAKPLVENGYPKDDTNDFLQDTVPMERVTWVQSDAWTAIGPFEKALDFFGDGSLYIVDAAGHMPGHINVLVRSDASGKWAYLAGDSAHDPRLLTGEKQIGHYHDGDGNLCCMHGDEAAAKEHIKRIASLPDNVAVWIAHDANWEERWKACQ